MEPIPETAAAIHELDAFAADDDLLEQLVASSDRVRDVVPDCIGLSFTLLAQDVTFTLVATAGEIAALDAVQYLDGGPCVRSVEAGRPVAVAVGDAMDEEGWHLFADATAARGVSSTLSLPLVVGERVTGGFNLYGASRRCFDGHHAQLAGILGAWAEGAVTNADLPFQTRVTARRAPQVLRDAAQVDVARGLLAARLGLDIDAAGERLEQAAVRAGISPVAVARLVIDLLASSS